MLLLQATEGAVQAETTIHLFAIVMKGGWIMIPLFVLLGIAIFLMADTWVGIKKLRKVNDRWFSHLVELVRAGDFAQAAKVAKKSGSALGRMAVKCVQGHNLPTNMIEEDMQVEARQAISKPEASIGYLSVIATVAPMLGFLGTIFGVIKIFFNISITNDLSISSISDGLYQKMVCSGAGLLIGIIAYLGYYILNRYVDTIILTMDRGGNELIKAVSIARGEAGDIIPTPKTERQA